MYDLSKLGERLKEIVAENQTSVKEICEKTGLSTSQFYRWQNNTAVPSLEHLIILADHLKFSIDFVIGSEEENSLTHFYEPVSLSERLPILVAQKKVKPYNVYTKLEISSSTFYNWWNGKYVPLLDNILKLAHYFDCSVDYLIGREI